MHTETSIAARHMATTAVAIFNMDAARELPPPVVSLRATNQGKYMYAANLHHNTQSISKAWLLLFCLFAFNIIQAQTLCGAERTAEYFPKLKGKKVGVVSNQTSVIGKHHLVDSLLKAKINIVKVFGPEHGFRGDEEAGRKIKKGIDKKTKLPVISLYGDNHKPTVEDLQGIDIMVFDIQDVGCRFYTYLSTMHYVMEACAENKILLIILDRPNPNGFYVDGPVLDTAFRSFVGMHPIPIVHGMTLGELAKMINGEHWLANGIKCDIEIIPCYNYNHTHYYEPPIPPSPNLPTIESIYLYPSLCLFEGTDVSVGRGTHKPFELIGKPDFEKGTTKFTPKSIKGVAENPPYKGLECKGFELTNFSRNFILNSRHIYLYWLMGFYEMSKDTNTFFNPMFDKLVGSDSLRKQLMERKTVEQIYKSWEPGLRKYIAMRQKYLIYID